MTAPYLLRPMTLDDISQVLWLDQASFPIPWSARTYEFEIANSSASHLVVLEAFNSTTPTANRAGKWWQRLRKFAQGRPPAPLVGYGGFWLIAGEAHISTIAVHPDYRGRGLGEVLLAGMLQRAIRLGGEYSVLEVRVTNHRAQQLYYKYEYQVVGQRRGYYRDNNEDALLMEVRPLDKAYQERFAGRVRALRERVDYRDRFTVK